MVVRHALIGTGVVGVDLGIGRGVLRGKPLQSRGIRIGNNLCRDLIAVAVFHANYSRFAGSTTSGASQLFAFGLTHVLALATEISLIYFDRPVERAAALARPSFTDAVKHKPSCRLRHADVRCSFMLDTDLSEVRHR